MLWGYKITPSLINLALNQQLRERMGYSATSTSFADRAGASVRFALTFHLDQSMGAYHFIKRGYKWQRNRNVETRKQRSQRK
jgi:hypothetical protein